MWQILILLLVWFFMISPHILAEESLFEVSEAFLQSYQEKNSDEVHSSQLEDGLSLFHYYPILIQPDIKYLGVENYNPGVIDISFNSGIPILKTQKGNIIGQYSLLSPNLMDLVLYEKKEPEELFDFQISGYTIEAQSRLLNGFTLFYGYDALEDLKTEKDLILNDGSRFITRNAGLEVNILPGVIVNADYKKALEDEGVTRTEKMLNLAYNPGSFASFNAAYGIISSTNRPIESSIFPVWLTSLDQENSPDDVIIKQLGLALHPNEFSRLSADYILMNEKGEEVSSKKAVFSLQLGDKSKALNATYQMENEGNSDGFLRSTLDLGLDLNFAENSSLQFQYKWFLPEEVEVNDETRAEARLEIRF